MSKNARVRIIQRKTYKALGFEVVSNWRERAEYGGRTNHKTVARIATVKDYLLVQPNAQKNLWLKIDLTLNRLLKSGEITNLDKSKIEQRFAEFCPRPILSLPVSIKPPITLQSVREKYGL
jgi:hypothetical protein